MENKKAVLTVGLCTAVAVLTILRMVTDSTSSLGLTVRILWIIVGIIAVIYGIIHIVRME